MLTLIVSVISYILPVSFISFISYIVKNYDVVQQMKILIMKQNQNIFSPSERDVDLAKIGALIISKILGRHRNDNNFDEP